MNRVIALWAVPRSVSTAFEQMMRARGDHEVVHEPFVAFYYYGADRVNDNFNEGIEPDPSHQYSEILARILAAADERSVFFKDMAYHVRKCASQEFLANFRNTFLLRDPRRSLPSLYELMPHATLEEAGFAQQLRLMRMVADLSDEPLVAVDAEELRADPEPVIRRYCDALGIPFDAESLSWGEGSPSAEWKPWERWHREAIASTGFEPTTDEHEQVEVPPDVLASCVADYEAMLGLLERRGKVRENL